MILILFIWTLIFFIFLVIGYSVVKTVLLLNGQKETQYKVTLDEYFFIGFLSLSLFSGILSIWIPIGNKAALILIMLSLLLFLLNCREIQRTIRNAVHKLLLMKRVEVYVFFLIILFLLTVVVNKIIFYDTGLYHAQCIQWIRKYPVVPGLGNLHGRFALNSMFLVISALFTIQIKDVLIFPLNGICYVVVILKLFTLFVSQYKSGSKWLSVFYSAIILISMLFVIPFLNSTSPDIICGILIIYAFILITNRTSEKNENSYVKTILLSLVVFSCITYKISSLFLVLTLLLNLKDEFIKKSLTIFVNRHPYSYAIYYQELLFIWLPYLSVPIS